MSYYYVWNKLVKKFLIYGLSFLDLINSLTINNRYIYEFCLSELKYQLFEIKGECIHSAFCCNNIQIKYKGNWIKTQSQFTDIVKNDSVMSRFKPNLTSTKKIVSFSCDSLLDSNLCNHYESRPVFCRVYPFSIFFSNDTIKAGCGFYVTQIEVLPFFSSKKIKQEFSVFIYNNNLI